MLHMNNTELNNVQLFSFAGKHLQCSRYRTLGPFFDLLIEMPTEDKAAGRRAEESWLLANIMGTRPVGREVIKLQSTMASPLVNSSRGVFAS